MSFRVLNPFDQSLVCERSWDRGPALERKVAAAVRAQAVWRRKPLRERVRQVERGLAVFRRDAESIARDITRQMGKPQVQARREVEGFFDRAEYMISVAASSLSPELLPPKAGFHRRIEREPLGVVLNIAAWNYPLLIPVNVVVPALLAGNAVLLKHSAKTPLCGGHFQKVFGRLDPPGLVQDVMITHDQIATLLEDPRVAHVAFTGSVEGGRAVYKKAAHRFIDAGLELGGKDPAYVAEDADLDFAVENIVDGACYNGGQSCCAVERAYVHKKHYAAFLDGARAVMERYQWGNPMDESTTLGPLASASALDVLEGQVKDAVRRGAKLLLGGRRVPGEKGNFFPPTLLADVPNGAAVMQEESFGPVLPVARVKDDREALARMADTRYGLTASVWTRSRARAERFARELEAGTIFQNRCDFLDPALPWTGYKDSGLGCTLSRHGFAPLTRLKSLHFRLGS